MASALQQLTPITAGPFRTPTLSTSLAGENRSARRKPTSLGRALILLFRMGEDYRSFNLRRAFTREGPLAEQTRTGAIACKDFNHQFRSEKSVHGQATTPAKLKFYSMLL